MDQSFPSVSFIDRTATNPVSDDEWADINQYCFVKGNRYKAKDLTFCNKDCKQETAEDDSNIVQSQAIPFEWLQERVEGVSFSVQSDTAENGSYIFQSQTTLLTENQKSFSTLEGKNLALIINNYEF